MVIAKPFKINLRSMYCGLDLPLIILNNEDFILLTIPVSSHSFMMCSQHFYE